MKTRTFTQSVLSVDDNKSVSTDSNDLREKSNLSPKGTGSVSLVCFLIEGNNLQCIRAVERD